MRFLLRLIRRALAALHLSRGRKFFATGRFEAAASSVKNAIALQGSTFEAHFTLGQIYLRSLNFDRARREFAAARELDPGRFAAQGWPENALLRLAMQQDAATRGFDASRAQTHDAAAVAREPSAESCRENGDDFVSPAERERFRILPPIGADDIDRIDWDRARDLFDDP